MEKQPLETQTLYAELMERLTALEAGRSIGNLPGSFVLKNIKGEGYYYFQHSEPGGSRRQIYVGKKTPELEKLVSRYKEENLSAAEDLRSVERLCAMLKIGGAMVADTASARVVKALAESGVFKLGGVLVGTHAFTVLGNLLGVRWRHAALKTHDIDIASESVLDIAVPDVKADVPSALEELNMGFLPVPPLNPKNSSTSFKVRGNPLRVDLLTPTNRESARPIFISRLNASAQPVRFLDYLISQHERAALLAGFAVMVNVPAPARFALHKLLVSQERNIGGRVKIEKDLDQAAQMLSFLIEESPGDIALAWDEAKNRGEGFKKRILAGTAAMIKRFPALENIKVHLN